MQPPADIETRREACLRRMLDSPRHSCIGMHAEHAAAHALKGCLIDPDGKQVLSIFDIAEEIPIPARHPDGDGNRAMRRAAKARARRRA